jgi:hypothetical protein
MKLAPLQAYSYVKGKVNLSLCLTNSALRHEGVWGSGYIDPYFLDLGTSWRWVVSFTPRPLYPRGKSPRYPLDRRLGGPESVWTTWRRENSWPNRDSNSYSSVVQPVASRYTDYAILAPGNLIKSRLYFDGNEISTKHTWYNQFPFSSRKEGIKSPVIQYHRAWGSIIRRSAEGL